VPIHEIGERWIGKYERAHLGLLSELKKNLEAKPRRNLGVNPTRNLGTKRSKGR
jgi:hypothetical protein